MKITPAIPSEAGVLTEIAIAAKGYWGYPARWMEQWRPILTVSPDSIAAHETYAARISERIVGFTALHRKGPALHLEDLFVLPGEMGRGVGRALFRHALRRAHELGYSFVEVQSDPNAAGFYERMGAERTGIAFVLLDGHRRELPIFRCHTSLADDGT